LQKVGLAGCSAPLMDYRPMAEENHVGQGKRMDNMTDGADARAETMRNGAGSCWYYGLHPRDGRKSASSMKRL